MLSLHGIRAWFLQYWLVLELFALASAARPCNDNDWLFDISLCKERDDGSRSRDVFAYAPPGICNPLKDHSRPMPEPVFGVPCHFPCEAGTRLAVDLHHRGSAEAAAMMKVSCRPCEAGTFSLGGGFAIEGSAGEWTKTWPADIRTFCFYRSRDFRWHFGSGTAKAMACVLHLRPHYGSGSEQDLRVETRPGTWNQNLPDVSFHAPFAIAPGDSLACLPFSAADFPKIRGKALVVKRGTCTFQLKTEHALQAGAVAVVVYNNLPMAGYFYPAAVNASNAPNIPIFMITLEDGLQWVSSIQAQGQNPPHLVVSSPRCNESSYETLSTNSTHGHETNLTAEELARESWDSVPELGCSPWAPDPEGRFLHSGKNLRFHWMFSVLDFSARFVRDGHITFRYSVNAEDGFDGFSFVMDEVVKIPMTSRTTGFTTYRLAVPRGERNFRWTYQKDYSGSAAEDKAKIQLLEVDGTEFADTKCRSCHQSRGYGSSTCRACGKDEYLESNASKSENICRRCATGHWSLPGGVGPESCKQRPACTEWDIMTKYLAAKVAPNGSRVKDASADCSDGQAFEIRSYRQPMTCDPALADSVKLSNREVLTDCPRCEDNERRLNGGACTPIQHLDCPADKYSLRERKITQWRKWPQNFSTEVWGPVASKGSDPWGRGWQLQSHGHVAVVGSMQPDKQELTQLDYSGTHIDAALLHFDVKVTSEGKLSFVYLSQPKDAWLKALSLSINGTRFDLHPFFESKTTWQVAAIPLPEGQHRITWTWHYDSEEEQSNNGVQAGSGMWLNNVTVTYAVGGGVSRCERCPPGSSISADGTHCVACDPGWSTQNYAAPFSPLTHGCYQCPEGRFSGRGAASCEECGENLISGVGAQYCLPDSKALEKAGDEDHKSWNLTTVKKLFTHGGYIPDLMALKVEDRLFFIDPFMPAGRDDTGEAYWWERLPPRGSFQPSTTAPSSAVGGKANSMDDTCQGEFTRDVASKLLSFDVSCPSEPCFGSDESTNEYGLVFQFAGACDNGTYRTIERKATLRLVCNRDLEFQQEGANFDAAGFWHVPGLAFASRPRSPASCEDISLEWQTPAACVVCRPEYWEPVAGSECNVMRQRVVTYVSRIPCVGGAPRPTPHTETCSTSGLALLILLGVTIPLSCFLCCLGLYVVLLRRRYAPYMKLTDIDISKDFENNVAPTGGPQPEVQGAPTTLAEAI